MEMQYKYSGRKKTIIIIAILVINVVIGLCSFHLGEKMQAEETMSSCPNYYVRLYDAFIGGTRDVTIPYLDIAYMPNQELMGKISSNMRKCFVKWMPVETFKYAVSDGSYVMLDTDKYLSIENSYKMGQPRNRWYLSIFNTLDMETGEVLYLDDFVEINEAFVDTILTEGVLKLDSPPEMSGTEEVMYYTENMLSNIDPENVLRKLKQCCEPYTAEYYVAKPAFYLREHRLYLTYVLGEQSIAYVELDDIEEYLKVEKW